MNGAISWCVRREGEIAEWFDARSVDDAKCLAEIGVDEMPYIGPLEAPTLKEVMTNAELKELAELLAKHTPSDMAEMADVCTQMRECMDAGDRSVAQEKAATAELAAKLAAARTPYRDEQLLLSCVLIEAKAALTRRVDADEAATLAALAAKVVPPSPTQLPTGLRVKRAVALVSVDLEALPSDYHSTVANADAILEAFEAGREVPGAVCETKTSVIYTRPKGSKP